MKKNISWLAIFFVALLISCGGGGGGGGSSNSKTVPVTLTVGGNWKPVVLGRGNVSVRRAGIPSSVSSFLFTVSNSGTTIETRIITVSDPNQTIQETFNAPVGTITFLIEGKNSAGNAVYSDTTTQTITESSTPVTVTVTVQPVSSGSGGSSGGSGASTTTSTTTDTGSTTATTTTTTTTTADTAAPDTFITSQPSATTNSTSPSFAFTSTESGSTFECQMDAGGYSSCATPKNYVGVADGSHTFYVRAIDSSGNTDASPASYTWTIDTTAPTVSSKNPTSGASGVAINTTVTATFSEAMDSSTIIAANFTLDGGGAVTGTVTYDSGSRTATFTPSSSLSYSTVYTATITTSVKDSTGNSMSTQEQWTFTTGVEPPDVTTPANTTAANFINAGSSTATSSTITLSLSATDAKGVTGYYASGTSTTPTAGQGGWTVIASTTSYSADVSFVLAKTLGTHTVYVWFKDAAGNVSGVVSDTITLNMAITTVDSVGNVGEYTSIAIGVNSKAYISYYNGTSADLKYATNESGSWVTSTVDSPNYTGKYSSIAMDGNNKARISYYYFQAELRDLKYATNLTGSWVTSTVDDGGGPNNGVATGMGSSIAIDSNGFLHISYYYDNSGSYSLKYATNLTGSWVTSTVDNNSSLENTSIAISPHGFLHISYHDITTGDLKYATNESGSWVTSVIENTNFGEYSSIITDSNSKVHIAYRDNGNGDLKYATNESGSWVTSVIDSVGNMGWWLSIDKDSGNNIHIAYYDNTSYDLKYATNSSGSWVISTIDSAGTVGQYTSIAIDSSNVPHIGYYDSTNGNLKYATIQ